MATDGTIYVGSDDDQLYAVTADGKLKWKLRLAPATPRASAPSRRAATSTAPDARPRRHDLRRRRRPPRDLARRHPALEARHPRARRLDPGDRVRRHGLRRLPGRRAVRGRPQRREALGGPHRRRRRRGPRRSAATGTIYVGSDDHALWAISPAGAVRWKVVTGAEIRGGAANRARRHGLRRLARWLALCHPRRPARSAGSSPRPTRSWRPPASPPTARSWSVPKTNISTRSRPTARSCGCSPSPVTSIRRRRSRATGTIYVAGDDAHLHAFR